jgi:hypothetical protein
VPHFRPVLQGLSSARRTLSLSLRVLALGVFAASWLRNNWGVEETE